MKFFIIVLISALSIVFAQEKNGEKTIELKTYPTKILLTRSNEYAIELYGHSARYHATEENLACLKKSLDTKKSALLTVTAYTLFVKECHLK